MNSVFMVKSPLQLLNAIEAKNYFKLEDKDCYLLLMGDRKSYSQLMELVVAGEQWANVILLNRVSLLTGDPWSGEDDLVDIDKLRKTLLRSSFFSIRRINRLVHTIKDVQHVFLGDNNNPLMRHFVNSLDHEVTVLLDDGTATLNIARQRIEGCAARKPDRLSKRIRLAAKKIFQKLNNQQPSRVVFFTAYKIPVMSFDSVIHNDFAYLRTKISELQTTETVYFLGSPLSEAGIMSESQYLNYINRVQNYYAGRNILYVSHRRESQDKLAKIEEDYGLEVACFRFPIEYQLAFIGRRPLELASFMSSALDNCRLIFGDKMKIVSFRVNEVNDDRRENVDHIYDNYKLSVDENFIVETEF